MVKGWFPRDPGSPFLNDEQGVYNHLRKGRYLGSITILSFGDWIPRGWKQDLKKTPLKFNSEFPPEKLRLAPISKGSSSYFGMVRGLKLWLIGSTPPSQQQSQVKVGKYFFKSNYCLGCFVQTTNQKVSYHQLLK